MSHGAGRRERWPSRAAVGYALVAGAATSWGTWPLILRRAERTGALPAALESTIMMAILTVVAFPFSRRDRGDRPATRWEWALVVWLGIGDALNVLLFFGSYQVTSIAIAVLTHYLTPILVAVAAPLLLGERASLRTAFAVALSFGGLVLLLAPWNAQARPTDLLGALLGAGSAVFYASNVLVTKRIGRSFSGSELSFFHGLVATPLLALFVPHGAWSAADPRGLATVAIGALGPGALAGLAFVWGLRRVAASHASTLTLLEPLVAVLVGVAFFGERLTTAAVIGGVMILAGAAVVIAKPAVPEVAASRFEA